MLPVVGYRGTKVAVLGLGRSGLAAARALRAGRADVICWDDGAAARQAAADEGFDILDLNKDASWDGVVLLVTSPGIAHLYPEPHPLIAKAWSMGVAVDNDVGLFFRSYGDESWARFDAAPRVVCITGSNGKSTTTALLAHVLRFAGKPVQVGGNIGRGVLDLDPAEDGEVVVLELSSYQTDLARSLAPDIAVFLNLVPDHLDRHGGMGGYFAAKRRLFSEGGPERAVIGVDQIEGQYLANQMRQEHPSGEPVIKISTLRKLRGAEWSVFARKGFLSEWRKGRQIATIDLREMQSLPGAHNHENACAAYAAARSLGVAPKKIKEAMETFRGLPHRCQVLGRTETGALVVNDSKATNTDAAEKALLAFESIHWIAGGRAKDGGITDLMPLMERVAHAYLIGESAGAFAAQIGDAAPHSVLGDISAAVGAAVKASGEGDVILLSPAAASFDQFPDFEARGAAFVAAIEPHLT
ncbi:MAG: UDP-N-acetylmuramoyl-L-alanine--D-glutamate ligase [Pseudomonadota bacterium]